MREGFHLISASLRCMNEGLVTTATYEFVVRTKFDVFVAVV